MIPVADRIYDRHLRELAAQTELARVLETTQANVSRIEHSENLYLRTLADYVGALGGHIEVNAVFDDDIVPLGLVEKDRGSVAA